MKLSEHPNWEHNKLNIIRNIIDELKIPYVVTCDDRYKEFIFRSTNERNFIVNISENIIGLSTKNSLKNIIDSKIQDVYKIINSEDKT